MSFIPVIKADFSASLLQSSMSHGPSENIFWYDETFIFISMLKTFVQLNIFVETIIYLLFQDYLINSSKEQPLK